MYHMAHTLLTISVLSLSDYGKQGFITQSLPILILSFSFIGEQFNLIKNSKASKSLVSELRRRFHSCVCPTAHLPLMPRGPESMVFNLI